MKSTGRSDLSSIVAACAAISVVPLGLWASRPRPLEGASSAEIAAIAQESRQAQILDAMRSRYEAASLVFEGPDPAHDPDLRWREIQSTLQERGAEASESAEVVRRARARLGDAWPCIAESGWWRGQAAWVIVGSVPRGGAPAWICPPSTSDIYKSRVERYCSDVRASVVSARSPYSELR